MDHGMCSVLSEAKSSFSITVLKKIMKNRKKVNNSTKTVFSSKLVLFLCFPMTKSCKWNIYIPFNTSSIFALICQKKTNFVIPIQIDSKSRVCKFSKHLKILKMRSLEGCETKSMQNFGFLNPLFKRVWPIFWVFVPCIVAKIVANIKNSLVRFFMA